MKIFKFLNLRFLRFFSLKKHEIYKKPSKFYSLYSLTYIVTCIQNTGNGNNYFNLPINQNIMRYFFWRVHYKYIQIVLQRYKQPGEGCIRELHLHNQQRKGVPNLAQLESRYRQSVGQVLFRKQFKGTCIAIGKHQKRFIITPYHVLMAIGMYRKSLNH